MGPFLGAQEPANESVAKSHQNSSSLKEKAGNWLEVVINSVMKRLYALIRMSVYVYWKSSNCALEISASEFDLNYNG